MAMTPGGHSGTEGSRVPEAHRGLARLGLRLIAGSVLASATLPWLADWNRRHTFGPEYGAARPLARHVGGRQRDYGRTCGALAAAQLPVGRPLLGASHHRGGSAADRPLGAVQPDSAHTRHVALRPTPHPPTDPGNAGRTAEPGPDRRRSGSGPHSETNRAANVIARGRRGADERQTCWPAHF